MTPRFSVEKFEFQGRLAVFLKNHRAGTKRTGAVEPVRLLQLSAAGEVFLEYICRDTACRVRRFRHRKSRWKRSTGTFPKSEHSRWDTGRSGLVRSALEKLSLFSPTFSVRQKYGAGNFAVCGQRLRGHVPSKNTSPAALSWSSLIRQRLQNRSVSAQQCLR